MNFYDVAKIATKLKKECEDREEARSDPAYVLPPAYVAKIVAQFKKDCEGHEAALLDPAGAFHQGKCADAIDMTVFPKDAFLSMFWRQPSRSMTEPVRRKNAVLQVQKALTEAKDLLSNQRADLATYADQIKDMQAQINQRVHPRPGAQV